MTPSNISVLRVLSFVVCAFILQACGRDSSAPLPEQKMRDLLFDIQVAEAYSANVDTGADRGKKNRDTLAHYYALVLKKHGITLEEWEAAMEWYMRNPADLDPVLTKVIDTANTFKKEQMEAIDGAESATDSLNVLVPGGDTIIRAAELKPLQRPLNSKKMDKPAINEDISKEISKEERDAIKKNSKEKREALEKIKNEQ